MKASRELSKRHCYPSNPSLTYSTTTQPSGLPHPGEYLRLHPLLHNRQIRQKNMAQMKEQIKVPEKIQLSDEEIAKLSYAEFKTLVIRLLTEMVEYGRKVEENVKAVKVK